MSTTKAHSFQQQQARTARPPKPPAPPRRRRAADDDAATVGADGKPRRGPDARAHAGRRGGSVLEPVAPGTTSSRKSTRKSVDHVKQSTNLQLKASRATAAPSARAARGAVSTRKLRAESRPARASRPTKRA